LTDAGLSEIEVCAFELLGPEITECEFTDLGGSYELTDLPIGTYKVGFFSESVEEEEEVGLERSPFPVQFWNDKPGWETADILTLGLGLRTGIDAALGSLPSTPAGQSLGMAQASTFPSVPLMSGTARVRCRSGSRLKKVKGKMRCVKMQKRAHRKRAHRR
jgi:hypothetical protein